MSLLIYTYSDPYKLNQEPYWDDIKTCPYFCSSQTLAAGLKSVYRDVFEKGRVTTVKNLTEAVFEEWENTNTKIKQHTHIDNIITEGLTLSLNQTMKENIQKAFLFNREEVFKSIRIMFELNMDVSEILLDKLTPEQLFIVEIYKQILNSNKKMDFLLNTDLTGDDLDIAIKTALEKDNPDGTKESLNFKRIVIHGVHQFTPTMLRLIEKLSEHKEVILLFNYQKQYKNIYQTWIDIYSAFDHQIITHSGQEFKPNMMLTESYKGNLLADNIGKLVEGKKNEIVQEGLYEIIEYDNLTEFANYVTDVYNDAKDQNPDNPLRAMNEQFYAADNSVNDILKIYFPEQFGERQFLHYPLGQFFMALANMWDANNNGIIIKNLNDIRECLSAGILEEEYLGELSTIFNKLLALFDGCTSIDEMTARMKRLKKNKKNLFDSSKMKCVSHISYYSAGIDEIEKLLKAFDELKELAAYFYEDFDNKAHNFKEFYKKLKSYLQEDILTTTELSEEFSDIIRRVLIRLEEVEDIDASASFECLKSTMSIYLAQETKKEKGANWIVRGFEQLEGDILRSLNEKEGFKRTYHFACLSDEDITASGISEFPWPLDGDFFEVAQEPVDWKYQVYVKARKEYKNFKRYALVYGLEFNRSRFKLSYVRRNEDKEREPYYLLKLLAVKKTPHSNFKIKDRHIKEFKVNTNGVAVSNFNEFDYYRYKICKYRFLMESILENTTIYKDNFLLLKYMEVLLENRVKEEMQGFPISEVALMQKLEDVYDEIKKYFPFAKNVNRIDIIGNIKSRMLNVKTKAFPELTDEERRYMKIRELFIHKQLSDNKTFRKNILSDKFADVSADHIKQVLSQENLQVLNYKKEVDIWCQYCSNREACMAYYVK